MKGIKEVLEAELKDLYSAENQLVKALPKMAKGAVSEQLRAAFEAHLEQTRVHVTRLEKVAEIAQISLKGKRCKGMEGLLIEGSELLSEEKKSLSRDVALIPAAQRVEHYEMAAYGSAVVFARMLGLTQAEKILNQTLEEEKKADAKLTQIAEGKVNPAAMAEAQEAMAMNGKGHENGKASKPAAKAAAPAAKKPAAPVKKAAAKKPVVAAPSN